MLSMEQLGLWKLFGELSCRLAKGFVSFGDKDFGVIGVGDVGQCQWVLLALLP